MSEVCGKILNAYILYDSFSSEAAAFPTGSSLLRSAYIVTLIIRHALERLFLPYQLYTIVI
jgi:hypothetical protein